jgi:deoxyribodipyrimidine photolyase-related protein
VMHADGGLLASKPYAASGKYIQRMGNYCKNCRYKVAETVGDSACPFNALYWDFLERHRQKLQGNPRMGMMYRNLDRMDQERRQAITDRAIWIRQQVDSL